MFRSELQRLLTKIDFMFNTYIRDNVLKGTVEKWCDFLFSFLPPEENEKNIWQIGSYPLLILDLTVN